MGDLTLRQALDEYKDIYMASRNFTQRTRVEYLNDLDDLIRFMDQLGTRRVGEMGLPQLERYLAELDRRGMAGSTRKRKVVVIRSFLWYLYQDGYLSINLAKRLIPPFAEARSPRYLTELECNLLQSASRFHLRDHAIIWLLLYTGIKLSEIVKLTIHDIEIPDMIGRREGKIGYLRISGGRTKVERVITLDTRTCIALSDYLSSRKNLPKTTLFTNRFDTPLSCRSIEKILAKYAFNVGIKNINVQTLRHTYAVRNLASGMALAVLKTIMGYRDLRSLSMFLDVARALNPRLHLQ